MVLPAVGDFCYSAGCILQGKKRFRIAPRSLSSSPCRQISCWNGQPPYGTKREEESLSRRASYSNSTRCFTIRLREMKPVNSSSPSNKVTRVWLNTHSASACLQQAAAGMSPLSKGYIHPSTSPAQMNSFLWRKKGVN